MEAANPHRSVRVGNIDEGGLVVHPDDGVVSAALRIGPAPHIIGTDARAAADVAHRQKRQQVDVVALKNAGTSVDALKGLAQDGRELLGATLRRRRAV